MDNAALINREESILTPNQPARRAMKRPMDESQTSRNSRAWTDTRSSSNSSSSASYSFATPTPTRKPSTDLSVVKNEATEDKLLPRKDRVQILAGPHNTEFWCSKANLAKSPILSGYIVEHPNQQAYIMHPTLTNVHPNDLSCVVDFLRTGTYTPRLDDVSATLVDPKKHTLDEVAWEEELRREVKVCGRPHVLAKRFQLPAMVERVFTELTAAYMSAVFMEHTVVLELARTVFSSPGPRVKASQVAEGGQEDALEMWLVSRIVENLEPIMMWRSTSVLFWEVMRAGRGRGLSVKVFRGRAELDGKDPDFYQD